jgi:hypothetical protein
MEALVETEVTVEMAAMPEPEARAVPAIRVELKVRRELWGCREPGIWHRVFPAFPGRYRPSR